MQFSTLPAIVYRQAGRYTCGDKNGGAPKRGSGAEPGGHVANGVLAHARQSPTWWALATIFVQRSLLRSAAEGYVRVAGASDISNARRDALILDIVR